MPPNADHAGHREVIGLLTLIANLGVLALGIKLYTEYFKDRSQARRASPNDRTDP